MGLAGFLHNRHCKLAFSSIGKSYVISGSQSTIRSSDLSACILEALEGLLLVIVVSGYSRLMQIFGAALNLLVMSLRGPSVGLLTKFC